MKPHSRRFSFGFFSVRRRRVKGKHRSRFRCASQRIPLHFPAEYMYIAFTRCHAYLPLKLLRCLLYASAPCPPSRPFQPHYPYAIAPLSFAVFLFPCRFFLPFRSYPFYAGAHGRDQSFFRSRGVEFCSTLVNGDDRKRL